MQKFVLLLALLIGLVNATGWRVSETSRPSRNDLHEMTVALKPRNRNLLDKVFKDVSDPKSDKYRQFMTLDEVNELTAPDSNDVERVIEWLEKQGAVDIEPNRGGDLIRVVMPVEAVERSFGVSMGHLEHEHSPHKVVRSDGRKSAIVPDELKDIVVGVSKIDEPPVEPRLSRKGRAISRAMNRISDRTRGRADSTSPYSYNVTDAPIFAEAFASDTTAFPLFFPVCNDFTFPTSATDMCASTGETITGFKATYTVVNSTQVITSEWSVDEVSCEAMQIGGYYYTSSAETLVFCAAATSGFLPYSTVNMEIQTVFESQTSGPGVNPYPTIMTPFLTSSFLRDQYHMPRSLRGAATGNSQAVIEFIEQFYNPADLDMYLLAMGLPGDMTIDQIGPNNVTMEGGESQLDIENILVTGAGIDTTFWVTPNFGFVLDWAWNAGNRTTIPYVMSVSYGISEQDVGEWYIDRCNIEFQKMGVRGSSVMVSSGDGGAADLGHGGYYCDELLPQYPTSSPFVTSVSATVAAQNTAPICFEPFSAIPGSQTTCSQSVGEIAVDLGLGLFWTTGGGFSNYTARSDGASYQDDAVQAYLDSAPLPPSYMFNADNRGYPDVSAFGHNGLVVMDGAVSTADGTSLSSPLFSGLVAQLNDLLLLDNQPPLGFLNPWLYQLAAENPGAFNDVTVGSNADGDAYTCPTGYNAWVGWDAVTGLGSLNFDQARRSLSV